MYSGSVRRRILAQHRGVCVEGSMMDVLKNCRENVQCWLALRLDVAAGHAWKLSRVFLFENKGNTRFGKAHAVQTWK